MLRRTALVSCLALLTALPLCAQTKLSAHWEELTAADFREGIKQAAAANTNRMGG